MTPHIQIIKPSFWLLIIIGALASTTTLAMERPDRLSIQSLLQNEKYSQLDRELSAYQSAYENRKTSDTIVSQAFVSFENSAPWLEQRLNTWLVRSPNSYNAFMARGAYYFHLGWLSRGYRYSHKTSEEQIKGMKLLFSKATGDFKSALNLNPKLTVAYDYLISIAKADKKTSLLTNELFRKAERIDAASFITRRRYLSTLQPKWGGSVKEIKSFIRESKRYESQNKELAVLPGYLDIYYADYVWKKDKELAKKLYNRALGYGNYWWFLLQRGENLYFAKDYQKALNDLTQALEINPQSVSALKYRGWTYLKLKRDKEALQDFNLAVKLDALEPYALRGRGRIFYKQKNYYSALADFDNALVYGAHKHRNWWQRGRTYLYGIKNYQKATSDLQQAIKLAPERKLYWYHYSVAQHYTGDCDIVNSFKTYLRLCESKSNCKKKRVRWAEDSLNYINQTRNLQVKKTGDTKRCI